jgi:ribosomal-protein-alanine N-acetyltransferase
MGEGLRGISSHQLSDLRVIRMRRRHLPGVLRIENRSYPRPWSLGIFLSEISLGESRQYFVAVLGSKVIGYCGMMVILDECHITNIAVDGSYGSKGVAKRLLLNAFEVAQGLSIKDMTLEVRASNQVAQRLYFKFGFEPVGIRKNYYAESNEDAVIMWCYDIASEENTRRREKVRAELKEFRRDATAEEALEGSVDLGVEEPMEAQSGESDE